MSYPSKSRVLSYNDLTRALIDRDAHRDVEDACKAFTTILVGLMDQFESISKMVHTLDFKGLTVPLRPRWDIIRKDFAELLQQFRSNVGVISGRLRIFASNILPMVAQKSKSISSQELLQLLRSFMAFSTEQANLTRSFVEHSMRLSAVLSSFHTEFSKLTILRTNMGQSELRHLSTKIHELDICLRQLATSNTQLSDAAPTHLMYNVLRLGMCTGRRPTRSKVFHQKLTLSTCMPPFGLAYDAFDQKRSEVAHAVYNAQLCFGERTNLTNTQLSLSVLVSDEITHLETAVNFVLGIWARLRTDCTEIHNWLNSPSDNRIPSVVSEFSHSGTTFYPALASALDVCFASIDPSRLNIEN